MSKISRRSLARYAVEQLTEGRSAAAIAKHLAGALVESGRRGEVEFLLGDIAWELERRGLVATATITTATPLTDELEGQLKSQIKKASGTQDVTLKENLDRSVIGGLKIETTARVWDSTVKRQLNQIKESA